MDKFYKNTDKIDTFSNYTKSLIEDIRVDGSKIDVILNCVNITLLIGFENKKNIEFLR